LEKERDQFDALLLSSIAQAHLAAYGEAIDALNRALRYPKIESRIVSFLSLLQFTGSLAARPTSERPLCLLAHYYRYLRIFDGSNAAAAVAHAKAAIAASDYPEKAHLSWGVVEYRRNRNDRALDHFLTAIELDNEYALAYRWAASVYSERGDLANEYKMLRAAYESASEDPFHSEDLAHFLSEKLGDYEQALALSLNSLKKNPTNAAELARAAYLYAVLGDEKQAMRYYEDAIRLEPRNPLLHEQFGMALTDMERAGEAMEAYLKSISIEPRRPAVHSRLAHLYTREGRFDDARRHYEQAFRYGESDLASLESLCGVYHQLGEYERAARCLQRVLSIDPDNIPAQHLYSYVRRNVTRKVSQ
jgi:tetratricopeptide (TPR) repeat protein